jgi:hypothetical protein
MSGGLIKAIQQAFQKLPEHIAHEGVEHAFKAVTEFIKKNKTDSQSAQSLSSRGSARRQPLDDGYTCPEGYPVKGSAQFIYHLPGERFYQETKATDCFASETEARAAGFRKYEWG